MKVFLGVCLKMEEEIINYYTNNKNKSLEEDWHLFFEYQTVIMEDLKRIAYKVSDYEESKEKEQLILQLHQILDSMCDYYYEEDIEENYMDLEIKVTDNHLAFSYYKLDKKRKRITNKPSIVIISRNMRNLYFIDERNVLVENKLSDYVELSYVGLSNEYEDYSLYSIESYELEEESIIRERNIFESYVHDVTYPCFYETEKMVEKIKKLC